MIRGFWGFRVEVFRVVQVQGLGFGGFWSAQSACQDCLQAVKAEAVAKAKAAAN